MRISVALSVIKRIPVRIRNIRANRKKPGLAEQHLKGMQCLFLLIIYNVTEDVVIKSFRVDASPRHVQWRTKEWPNRCHRNYFRTWHNELGLIYIKD